MPGDGSFVDQFIDDYFAEAEEHLATARRVLLRLEAAEARSTLEPRLLRDLFRSLHTLKGLAGMVGDVVAERVTHVLEESLKAAERVAAPLEPAFVDALFSGVDLLERCITSRRNGESPPDAAEIVARLTRVAPRTRPSAPAEHEPASPPATGLQGGGEIVLYVEFAPSPALSDRGIGVDAVRARLRALGTLEDARPRLVDGRIVFDFWVSVPAGFEPDPAWIDDGLRWTLASRAVAREDEPAASGARAPVDAVRSEPGEVDRAVVDPGAAGSVAASPGAPGTASVVRVDLTRLDGVMRLVGDLVVSRSRLDDVPRLASTHGAAAALDALEETNAAMERQLRLLRESVMRIRLVPIGEVFERLRFAVRDAIRESRKEVVLSFHGQSTEIDKLVVDRMLEPLLHLVRNAVGHGIEPPEARVAAGKPAAGTISLRATTSGDRIRVEVEDDGAGIDLTTVEREARARGMIGPTEALASDRLLEVLCIPGFSTRTEADRTSGRGVGMDVVRAAVRGLAGELEVTTTAGQGTRFLIELPLTLMILDALLVEVGGRQLAVPQPALREIVQIDGDAIVSFEDNDVISWRGGALPLFALARLFGLPEPDRATRYVLVVGSDAMPVGLVVDRLLGLREIVVLPVADPLVAVPGISGATELGDGRVSLILDAAAVVRLAQERREHRARGDASLEIARRRQGPASSATQLLHRS